MYLRGRKFSAFDFYHHLERFIVLNNGHIRLCCKCNYISTSEKECPSCNIELGELEVDETIREYLKR